MIKLGDTNIKDVKLGSFNILKVYQGINLIWQKITKVLKSVSGGTSATLTDCYDDRSLVLLECQGNGSGDKTENIINPQDTICGRYNTGYYVDNKNYINSYTDLGVNITTNVTFGAIATRVLTKDELTTLFVKFNQDSTTEVSFGVGLQAYSSEDGANASKVGTQVLKQWGSILKDQWYDLSTTLRSISTYQNNNYFRVYIFCRTIVTDLQCDFCTDKVPYGYKIGVLCDSSIWQGNTSYVGGTSIQTDTTDLEQAKTYVLEFDVSDDYSVKSNGYIFSWRKNGGGLANINCQDLVAGNHYKYTKTGTDGLRMVYQSRYSGTISNIVLYESNKTPISLPMYLGNNQLYYFNDTYCDKAIMDFENKDAYIKQKTKTITVNGTETWSIFNKTDTNTIRFGISNMGSCGNSYRGLIKCDNTDFPTTATESVQGVICTGAITSALSGNICVRILKSTIGYTASTTDAEAIASFKTWLTSNPLTIHYALNSYNDITNSIKDINTTTLNADTTTFEGTTVIVDGSTNKVSGMDVEYYASK